jgi:hypothetical protein
MNRTFLPVLQNNYLRTIPRLVPVAVFTVVALAAILFSVYITGLQQVKGRIVLIPQNASVTLPSSSKVLAMTVLPPILARSEINHRQEISFRDAAASICCPHKLHIVRTNFCRTNCFSGNYRRALQAISMA